MVKKGQTLVAKGTCRVSSVWERKGGEGVYASTRYAQSRGETFPWEHLHLCASLNFVLHSVVVRMKWEDV